GEEGLRRPGGGRKSIVRHSHVTHGCHRPMRSVGGIHLAVACVSAPNATDALSPGPRLVHRDQASNGDDQEDLASQCLSDSHRPWEAHCRGQVAISDRRDRNEAEVDEVGGSEFAGLHKEGMAGEELYRQVPIREEEAEKDVHRDGSEQRLYRYLLVPEDPRQNGDRTREDEKRTDDEDDALSHIA